MQKHLRAARESLTKQEIPTQANSVVTLCAAVAMVLLLCATIAGTSLPADVLCGGVHGSAVRRDGSAGEA